MEPGDSMPRTFNKSTIFFISQIEVCIHLPYLFLYLSIYLFIYFRPSNFQSIDSMHSNFQINFLNINNTSKYHVACTDGKTSVSINLLFYLFSPSSHPTFVCFFPVGLSMLILNFQQVLWVLKLLLSPVLGS